jgi:gamma-glutamyltranspeptidase/glutathione hydrolase
MNGSFSRSQTVVKSGAGPTPMGVVAAQHVLAAETGAEVLAAGGDAIDAAVAVSFAIGVLEPWMSGPAGGGAMMIWRSDRNRAEALHFGMCASASLDPAYYPLSGTGKAADLFAWDAVVDDRNIRGGSAVAVPGVVAGAAEAHARYGRMPWADLLTPAISFAKAGMEVDWYATLLITSVARDLARDPHAAAMFLDERTWPKAAGWTALSRDLRLDQGRMASTLQQIASDGPDAFYKGQIGAALTQDVRDKGGFLTRDDLAAYRAEWMDPLAIRYRGHQVWAVPRLTAGPALADTLGHWESSFEPGRTPEPGVWVAKAAGLHAAFERRLASDGDTGESPAAPACTTHFSIVDRQGNMVAMTQTLLSAFGARVVSPTTGLLLNNGLMWFDPVPGRPNSLAPGKRCLMNVCPVIAGGQGRQIAVGASGGRKIMPAVAQITSRLLDERMDVAGAVAAPRIDVSGGAVVVADERLDGTIISAIAERWPVDSARRLPFPYAFACPAVVMREDGMNSGTVETMSPWGDGIAEVAQ